MDESLTNFALGLISGATSGVFASFLVWFLVAKVFTSKLKFSASIKRRAILEGKKAASIKIINKSTRVAFRVAIFARLHVLSNRKGVKWDHYKIYFNKRSVDHEVAYIDGGRNAVLNLHFLDSYGVKQSVLLKDILNRSNNNQEFIELVFDQFPGSFVRLHATSFDGFTNSLAHSLSSKIDSISEDWLWKRSPISMLWSSLTRRFSLKPSINDESDPELER